MFSPEDIRHLTDLFSPQSLSGKTEIGALNDLPSLLSTVSGTGLVTQQHVAGLFEQAVQSASSRISLASLAHDLDISQEDTLCFLDAFPHLSLLSADKAHIITKEERTSLWKKLRNAAQEQLISTTSFSIEHDVCEQSVEKLVSTSLETIDQPDDLELNRDVSEQLFVVSAMYETRLKDIVTTDLSKAQQDAESHTFSLEQLPGQPPVWYLLSHVKVVVQFSGGEDKWHVQATEDDVICIPQEAIHRKRDEEIAKLATGTTPWINLDHFIQDTSATDAETTNVRDLLAKEPLASQIEVIGSIAISNAWSVQTSQTILEDLEKNGCANVRARINDNFPTHCISSVESKIRQHVRSTGFQHATLRDVDDHILGEEYYETLRTLIRSETRAQAGRHWESLQREGDQTLNLSIDDLPRKCTTEAPANPETTAILYAIIRDTTKEVEAEYWNEVLSLESKNETEFSQFWIDRVALRIHVYSQSLATIEDKKLEGQLADLLSAYFLKELIPDTISRAQSQGLLRSRRTRRNIQKLQNVLKPGSRSALGVTDVVTAVDKFSKKQGIQGADAHSKAEWKKAHISDLDRKMQKSADGPLLFLTLIVILLAKHQDSLIYATGKFAPKLLKQLKSSLSADEYNRLEKWKDQARAGTLESADKEQMMSFASS